MEEPTAPDMCPILHTSGNFLHLRDFGLYLHHTLRIVMRYLEQPFIRLAKLSLTL